MTYITEYMHRTSDGSAKNGEEAGTAGYSYRLEAIQVVMVPKGTENPQLPGVASATKEAFIQK